MTPRKSENLDVTSFSAYAAASATLDRLNREIASARRRHIEVTEALRSGNLPRDVAADPVERAERMLAGEAPDTAASGRQAAENEELHLRNLLVALPKAIAEAAHRAERERERARAEAWAPRRDALAGEWRDLAGRVLALMQREDEAADAVVAGGFGRPEPVVGLPLVGRDALREAFAQVVAG